MSTSHPTRLYFPSLLLLVAATASAACSSSNNAQDDGGADAQHDGATSDSGGEGGFDGAPGDGSVADGAGSDASNDGGAADATDASDDTADASDDTAPVDAGPPVWHSPQCGTTRINSQGSVTYTFDEGGSLAPLETRAVGISYTYALATVDTPNNVYAEHAGKVIRSEDAGCTWRQIGTVPQFPTIMASGPGGRVYAFTDNNNGLYRIEGDTITTLTVPATYVVGLGVDENDGLHIRIGDTDGRLHESFDGGATWNRLGTPVPFVTDPVLVYRYAFDPHDLNHIVVGVSVDGAFETDDGGQTWAHVMGPWAHNANVFSIVISPVDPSVVWMQGIDLDHTGDPISEGRNIWRSGDRGLTVASVAQQSDMVTIRNQELLAAHPTDVNVLYFVFGTYWDNYGTDIYRLDYTTGQIKKTHNQYNDVNAIAFSPVDPSVMYLGITWDAHL